MPAIVGDGRNYASKYKECLPESGVIGGCYRDTFCFDLPGFSEFLQDRMGEAGE